MMLFRLFTQVFMDSAWSLWSNSQKTIYNPFGMLQNVYCKKEYKKLSKGHTRQKEAGKEDEGAAGNKS